jgi:hypothetical protein
MGQSTSLRRHELGIFDASFFGMNSYQESYQRKRTIRKAVVTAVAVMVVLMGQATARASFIENGVMVLEGDFTLNHLYEFDHPEAQPFGWFGDQTVISSVGTFAPFIPIGAIMGGGQALNTVTNLPVFTVSGLTFITTGVGISSIQGGAFVSALFGNDQLTI